MTIAPSPSEGRALRITPDQRLALQLLASGRTTTDVAAGLGMDCQELDALLSALCAAMGAANLAAAVTAAHRRGLLA